MVLCQHLGFWWSMRNTGLSVWDLLIHQATTFLTPSSPQLTVLAAVSAAAFLADSIISSSSCKSDKNLVENSCNQRVYNYIRWVEHNETSHDMMQLLVLFVTNKLSTKRIISSFHDYKNTTENLYFTILHYRVPMLGAILIVAGVEGAGLQD